MIRGARRKSKFSHPHWYFLTLVGLVFGGWMWSRPKTQAELPMVEPDPVLVAEAALPVIEEEFEYDASYVVQDGDALSDVFKGYEVPYPEIVALEQAKSDIFRFRNVQPGREVFFTLNEPGSDYRLNEVIYQPDNNRLVKALQTPAGWIISEEKIQYQVEEDIATGMVENSLYLSALEQGLDEKVILGMADLFAWDINFALDTRAGDEYKVIYEKKFRKGRFITTGKILAAKYVNRGNTFYAFYFETAEGEGGYYNQEGKSLQKSFLKAPVNYRYVSSGFSNSRFHPILQKNIPHNGVDYAADYGTPIISVADGLVTSLGWHTAYGNRIEVRHGDRYSSQYSHMSSFVKGMKVGDRVKQGDLVGYVGSTGYSTGNHLHFSMTEFGNYIDPSNIIVPEGEPVPVEMLDEYLELVHQRLEQL